MASVTKSENLELQATAKITPTKMKVTQPYLSAAIADNTDREARMLTFLFEACPAPGHYSSFLDQVTALRRILSRGGRLVEEQQYSSATREGWLLWLSTWSGRDASASFESFSNIDIAGGCPGDDLIDYRCRAGRTILDTTPPKEFNLCDAQCDKAGEVVATLIALSVESKEISTTSGDLQQLAKSLGLDVKTQDLAEWNIFEAFPLGISGNLAALQSWSNLATAKIFEYGYKPPVGVRMRRIDLVADYRQGRPVDYSSDNDTVRSERRDLELLADAGAALGASLDVVGTAQALTDLLVPRLATAATVDVSESNISEGSADSAAPVTRLLRAGAAIMASYSSPARDPDYSTPQCLPIPAIVPPEGDLRAFDPEDAGFAQIFGNDIAGSRYVRAAGLQSVGVLPLRGREVSGALTIYHRNRRLSAHGMNLVREISRRAAIALDNSLAYTRERDAAAALRVPIIPNSLPATPGLQMRNGFIPCGPGEWFDVIRLPGARTALILGNTAEYGPFAESAASRFRAATQALSSVDMSPQEIMTRLNDLAVALNSDLSRSQRADSGYCRSTCLYLVYDPIQMEITFSGADHQSLIAITRLREVRTMSGATGPALGKVNEKYSQFRVPVEAGSHLTLLSNSLPDSSRILEKAIAGRQLDIDEAFLALADIVSPGRAESASLVVTRADTLSADQTASWQFPCDIAIVSTARALAEKQMDVWGLGEDTKFTAILAISELLTNAILHASAPISVRLLHLEGLTCEVSDGSQTAPYLKHALPDDEGGRGLFIVAKSVSRWGVRHGAKGKTIWTEQDLIQP